MLQKPNTLLCNHFVAVKLLINKDESYVVSSLLTIMDKSTRNEPKGTKYNSKKKKTGMG